MVSADRDESPLSQQRIEASEGSTIQDVIQAVISGEVTGDVHIGDKIYARSDLEELNDYLARAAAAFEARMYQALRQADLPDHPYRFLHPFELAHSRLFFGRDDAIQELYDKVMDGPLTVLHARSGAGKTSLLNAGLSPKLIDGGHLPVYVRTRPYEEDLTPAVKQAVIAPTLGPWPELLPELSLRDFLGLVSDHLSRQTRGLVVILDQFEQFLVSLPEPDLRAPFIHALGDACGDSSLPVRFILSLRRENTWDLDEFEPVIPRILQNRYGLPPMNRAEAAAAITGPIAALKRGISFEPELVESLLDSLGTEVELTHLQIVCTRLYDSLPEGETTLSTALYKSLGGIEQILANYLNDMLDELPEHKRTTARNVLKELVSSEATNRVLNASELEQRVSRAPELLEDVLESLVNVRLLSRGTIEDEPAAQEYELAHAYLAQEVIEWVDQDDLEVKRAQELLQHELASWRVHQVMAGVDALDTLRPHVEHLGLSREARELLFASALAHGHDVGFWLGSAQEKEAAIEQIAGRLATDPVQRRQIAQDLRSTLEQPLRPTLIAALQAVFKDVKGADRRNAARALWPFRSWLSTQELLRVVGVLAPVWALRGLPVLLLLGLLVLGGFRAWAFASRERALPGCWVTIYEDSFEMGMDDQEAEFARAMCLEGATEKENCPDPEKLTQRMGRHKEAWLPTFAIMDNEVTNAQYRRCIDDKGCEAPTGWDYERESINKPATGLNWEEATAYCAWLDGRLPTEAEWEKAARGPEATDYPWGNEWDSSKANLERSGTGALTKIDAYAESDVSGYGIKNMAGNVREWTASLWIPYAKDAVFTNTVLNLDSAGSGLPIVLRGGSWENERSLGMGSMRGVDSLSERRATTGFRCVCPTDHVCKAPWEWQWVWFGRY